MIQRDAIEKLVQQVLDGTEFKLKVDAYRLEEILKEGKAKLHCEVHHEQTGEKKIIDGEGVGIIDAFFHGLVNMYSEEYPSLTTIRFVDFSVKANLDTARESVRSDSTAVVSLTVANSEGKDYVFEDSSPSTSRSSINVVLQAAEFFMNCERAFIAVYRALQHAREENRADSVSLYTSQLATLVEATSYSEVIEQIREELKTNG